MTRFSIVLCCVALLAGRAGAYQLAPVAENFDKPVAVVPGALDPQKLYVTEHSGRIVTVDTKSRERAVYLDIADRVLQSGEAGLLSMAFDKRFPETGRIFVAYNARSPQLELTLSSYQGEHELKMLTIPKRFSNHNGGQLAFGPEGYLYMSTGDGGGAGDPDGNGRNVNALLGKMLRLNPDTASAEKMYGIPADNPFAKGGGRPEIFAWGLRNVWRFSFDRKTGRLFGADVGQDRREEIDVIERGGDYGWSTMEGTLCFRPAQGCDKKGLKMPIYEYGRQAGISVTGGYVYRGSALPELDGVYVYGDYGSGRIWGLRYDQETGRTLGNDLLLETQLPMSAFGEDANGELLVVSYEGSISRLVK